MKKLTLIRHGKASQDYNFKDFDRPLLPSGIENTLVIANNYLPTIIHNATVWSSASRRTSETAIAFTQVCNIDVSLINFRVDLYTFESRELERIILTCYNEIENTRLKVILFVNFNFSLYFFCFTSCLWIVVVYDHPVHSFSSLHYLWRKSTGKGFRNFM